MFRDNSVAEAYFVITAPGAKNIGRRLRKALTHGPDSQLLYETKVLDASILESKYIKVFTLNTESMELISVAF